MGKYLETSSLLSATESGNCGYRLEARDWDLERETHSETYKVINQVMKEMLVITSRVNVFKYFSFTSVSH